MTASNKRDYFGPGQKSSGKAGSKGASPGFGASYRGPGNLTGRKASGSVPGMNGGVFERLVRGAASSGGVDRLAELPSVDSPAETITPPGNDPIDESFSVWLSSDGLKHSDGVITSWEDETGEVTLVPTGSSPNVPAYDPDVIDGNPGMRLPTSLGYKLLEGSTPSTAYEGVTLVMVSRATYSNENGTGGVSNIVMDNIQYVQQDAFDGPPHGSFIETRDRGRGWVEVTEGARAIVVVSPHAGGPPSMWINGESVILEDTQNAPANWSATGSGMSIHLTASENSWYTEAFALDKDVDPDTTLIDFGSYGKDTIHGYLASKYPSLMS